MGQGKVFKCTECGNEEMISFGIGYMYPELLDRNIKDALKGKFGDDWKKLVKANPLSKVEAERYLYRCADCREWENESSLDIFYPKPGAADDPEFDAIDMNNDNHYRVAERMHCCPNCAKPMKRFKNAGNLRIKCRRCGGKMSVDKWSVVEWD